MLVVAICSMRLDDLNCSLGDPAGIDMQGTGTSHNIAQEILVVIVFHSSRLSRKGTATFLPAFLLLL